MQKSTRFHGGCFDLEMLEIFTTTFTIISVFLENGERKKKEKKSSSKRCQAPINNKSGLLTERYKKNIQKIERKIKTKNTRKVKHLQ